MADKPAHAQPPAPLTDEQLERWRGYAEEAEKDALFLARNDELDNQRSSIARPQMQATLQQYLSGNMSSKELGSVFQTKTPHEWRVFGLKGAAALVMNQIVKQIPAAQLDPQLRAVLPAPPPDDEAGARVRMYEFYDFVEGWRTSHGLNKLLIQTANIPFLVSAWWHIQDFEAWPIFYIRGRKTLQREGLYTPTERPVADYFAFRTRFRQLQQALNMTPWRFEQLCERLYRGASAGGGEATAPTPKRVAPASNRESEGQAEARVWWVNSWKLYWPEGDEGYFWTAERARNGARRPDWENLTLVRPGDLLLLYQDKAVGAVAEVIGDPERAFPPEELVAEFGSKEGHRVRGRQFSVKVPVRFEEIPMEWRLQEREVFKRGGAFDKDGAIKKGYFFPVSVRFARRFAETFASRLEGTPLQGDVLSRLVELGDLAKSIQLMEGDAVDELVERFRAFEADPDQMFVVEIRRIRAAQLRQLLSNPAAITLSTFNREVWRAGWEVTPAGEPARKLKRGALGHLTLTESERKEALDALRRGRLKLHGNAVCGFGTQVFGTRLRGLTNEEKETKVREGLEILNRTDLAPLEKAELLDDLPGFGPSAATALVMFSHPTKVAVSNEESKKALGEFGYLSKPWQKFEEEVGRLRARLGAKDFLELDWFLYRLNHPKQEQGAVNTLPPDSDGGLQVVPGTPPGSFGELCELIRQAGLYYPAEVVANYLLALQTKRFVILTGVSGTGKTKLAQTVAEQLSATEEQWLVVAVRPDWTDGTGLLGYYNPILERYIQTPFLRLLLNAADEERNAVSAERQPRPFFLILDEMNLAHVEHYFSDLLSVMESGENIHLYDAGEMARAERDGVPAIPYEVHMPKNLFITGTVNVDETTYMFSPKVLDRAFTIELNDVDLAALDLVGEGSRRVDGGPLELRNLPPILTYKGKPNANHWQEFGAVLDGALRRVVVEIEEVLAEENRQFGYRVATEIAKFVTLAAEQVGARADGLWTALDLAILEKVLPKLSGTQEELEVMLTRLFGYTVTGEVTKGVDDNDEIGPEAWAVEKGRLVERKPKEGSKRTPRLPRSALKLWRMHDRLRQGFTSFIE